MTLILAGNVLNGIQRLNLQQFIQGSWKEPILDFIEPRCPFVWPVVCISTLCGAMTSKGSNSPLILPVVPCLSKYDCSLPLGGNLTNCLWLDISWLRPTSRMQKILPEIINGLVSWMSTVLCLIPDSLSLRAMGEPVFCMKILLVSVPTLFLLGQWFRHEHSMDSRLFLSLSLWPV